MSLNFHPLKVKGREAAGEDAVCLRLEVPSHLADHYRFEPGQHVALRAVLDGQEVRRTYSIVNGAANGELKLAVRAQGASGLSRHLCGALRVGDSIDVLSPTGRFVRSVRGGTRNYLALAAGSGITPVLSIIAATLECEPGSRCILIYGNRTTLRTMLLDDVLALKNRFLGRFAVHFIMSREPQEIDLFNGRLDAGKIRALSAVLFDPAAIDEVFICGPGDMVAEARSAVRDLGIRVPVHFERFAAPGAIRAGERPTVAAGNEATICVVQDGRRRTFNMTPQDSSILAAAYRAGIDLPFSCRAGVCSTCRAKLLRGTVSMQRNVALEEWELAAGYVLCCQALPTAREIELSYDAL